MDRVKDIFKNYKEDNTTLNLTPEIRSDLIQYISELLLFRTKEIEQENNVVFSFEDTTTNRNNIREYFNETMDQLLYATEMIIKNELNINSTFKTSDRIDIKKESIDLFQ